VSIEEPPATYTEADLKRFEANLRDEVDGGALYRLLAEAEDNPHLKEVYSRLAAAEDRHAALWASKLQEGGRAAPSFRPSFRVRMLGWLARRLGTRAVMPIVTQMEMDATGMYDDQPEAVAEGLPLDERSHARIFREIGRSGRVRAGGTEIAQIEGRHRTASGNALRAAVLGAQDGLVSNLLLVMGVAGANPGPEFVLLAGTTGLLAGSTSMALGEWISVRSSAESFERQLAIERDELAMVPEEEEEELALIYQAKGVPEQEARAMASRIIRDPRVALDTLAREELGMAPGEAGSPWVASWTSFLTFAIGAAVPVLPWLVASGAVGVALSAVLSGVALFGFGALITLFTGRGALFSGARMLVFGAVPAAATFGLGAAIGAGTGI
jgi:VIT1/CCC1 family predicted Fe2+/Mn2+ transporter